MFSSAVRQITGACEQPGRGLLFGVLLLVLLLGPGTASAQIAVSLPDTSGVAGKTSTIPVKVGPLTGEEVFSFEFTVHYDADVLSVTGVETAGTRASGFKTVVNTDSSGTVTVSAAATSELPERGTLVNVAVRLEEAGTSPLSWKTFRFNEGSPNANLSDGTMRVASP